ncbi:MAG: magnesium transporter [Parcubacteria group bacterium LiPW_15]|nr:MAG: magnesium transporter [Parcubacteria group bacterium LiPW_15]
MERTFGEITWIDLIRPTKKNLDDLRRKFRLHEVIVKELENPSARSKVEVYGNYLYLIYYFPVFDPKEQTSTRSEIDFIITKDTVVTVHYEDVEPLKSVKEDFPAFSSSFDLTYRILSSLLNYQDRQLRHIREKVEAVGPMLFKNKERTVLQTVSRLKRDISEYRIISRHQSPIIRSLISNAKFFGDEESNRPYMDALLGDHIKILDLIEDYRSAVTDYEDTNNQLLNLRINDAMKTFTIMSFMTFPFVLFVALVDMNVIDNPFREMKNGFEIVVGLVVVGMIVLYNYFKNRRLL